MLKDNDYELYHKFMAEIEDRQDKYHQYLKTFKHDIDYARQRAGYTEEMEKHYFKTLALDKLLDVREKLPQVFKDEQDEDIDMIFIDRGTFNESEINPPSKKRTIIKGIFAFMRTLFINCISHK